MGIATRCTADTGGRLWLTAPSKVWSQILVCWAQGNCYLVNKLHKNDDESPLRDQTFSFLSYLIRNIVKIFFKVRLKWETLASKTDLSEIYGDPVRSHLYSTGYSMCNGNGFWKGCSFFREYVLHGCHFQVSVSSSRKAMAAVSRVCTR